MSNSSLPDSAEPAGAQEGWKEAELKLTSFLRQKGMRKTPERLAILRQALQMKSHFAVHELIEAMEERNYHVSRMTVYNTVQLLCDCGVLRRHLLGADQALYECRTTNHLHLVCAGCGKIREVSHPELSRLLITMKYPAFKATYFSATLFGYCSSCLRKQRAEEKNNKE